MAVLLELLLISMAAPLISCKSVGGGQGYYVTPNDTQTCANDLVSWCDGVKFPSEGGTISIVSVTILDSTGYCQAVCTADAEGTNCTKNGSPWLTCSKENKLFYKGNPLTKDSLENTDNGTCETADKAFNDLFVQNLSSDNATVDKELENGLELFFRAIQSMEERISAIQRQFAGAFAGNWPPYFSYPYPNDPNRPDSGDAADTTTVTDDREKE